MHTTILLLLLVVVIQLGVIIALFRRESLFIHRNKVVNPFFSVFDEESVLRAKSDLIRAEEKYDRALADAFKETTVGDKTESDWTDDLTIYRRFAEAEVALERQKRTVHLLIESNMAVLRGESISKLMEQYSTWVFKGSDEDLKTVETAVLKFKVRYEKGKTATHERNKE